MNILPMGMERKKKKQNGQDLFSCKCVFCIIVAKLLHIYSCQSFGNFITAVLFRPEYKSIGVKFFLSHWVPLFTLIPVIPLIYNTIFLCGPDLSLTPLFGSYPFGSVNVLNLHRIDLARKYYTHLQREIKKEEAR
jgi:hypothetical protein